MVLQINLVNRVPALSHLGCDFVGVGPCDGHQLDCGVGTCRALGQLRSGRRWQVGSVFRQSVWLGRHGWLECLEVAGQHACLISREHQVKCVFLKCEMEEAIADL